MEDRVVRAYLMIVNAQITAMGMQAENELRRIKDESPAYGEDAFNTLAGNTWNSTLELLAQ